MGFYLKKILTFFIEPFGMVLTLSIIGFYFLLVNKNRLAKIFIALSISLYLLFSNSNFSNFLIKNLETKYQKYNYDKPITYIQVLGSGNNKDKTQPVSSYLSSIAIKRVLEGVTIYKKTKNAKLVFSGYSLIVNAPQTADVYAEFAISLGVKKEDIIKTYKIKDTIEEARFMKKIVGKKEFALVTSASHMPRAMLIFHSVGLKPIAAPTDFHNFKYRSYSSFLDSIMMSKIAIHEYIGYLWCKLIY